MLLGGRSRAACARRRGHGARLRQPRRRARDRSSSACPASRATATTSRPTPSRAARSRSSSSARSGSACRRSRVDDVRAAMAPAAARFHGDPTRDAARRRRSPARTARRRRRSSSRALLEAGGQPHRAARHGEVGRRRRERAVGPHDARGDRPAGARSRAMRDAGDDALRDGGLLPRARAAPRRRDPLGRRGLHEPHAGPPRLPPDDGGLLRGQAAAVRRPRPAVARRQRRRPATARGWRPSSPAARSPSGIDAPGAAAARDRIVEADAAGTTFAADGLRAAGRRCPGASTSSTRSARSPRRARSASPTTTIAAALPRAGRVPGRFEPVDEGQAFARRSSTTRTRPTRSRTCCAPRAS